MKKHLALAALLGLSVCIGMTTYANATEPAEGTAMTRAAEESAAEDTTKCTPPTTHEDGTPMSEEEMQAAVDACMDAAEAASETEEATAPAEAH